RGATAARRQHVPRASLRGGIAAWITGKASSAHDRGEAYARWTSGESCLGDRSRFGPDRRTLRWIRPNCRVEHGVSALAGLVRFDSGPADAASVSRMIDCVPHRGIDWRSVWAHESVSFAYRWRRTRASQPVDRQPLGDPHSEIG